MNARDTLPPPSAVPETPAARLAAAYARTPTAVERPLHILVVDDSPDQTAALLRALHEGGLEPTWERVDTAAALRAALAAGPWDAVLSAYTLPGFGAAAALEIVRAADPDLPFVVVSGAAGEDAAVALMRATACDYVLKHDLVRLAPTVERELREAGNRRAKSAAERAAAHLAAVVDSSDDAIISKTLDGVITTWNPSAERLYGWTRGEAVGRHISILIPPDKADELAGRMALLLAGEPVGYFETVRLHRDGHRIDVAMTLSRVRDAAGRLVGVSKTARDIQERKRAEESLRRSEERSRLLVESIPALVWVYDATGRAVLHNRRWYDYTGQRPEEVAANRWHEAIHPDDAAAAVANWVRCAVSGEPYSTEYRLRGRGGSYRWFRAQATPMIGAGGIEQWVGICTDIDDLRLAQESLRQSTDLIRAVVEGTPDAVYVKDRDGKYLLFNEAAARLVGRPTADVLGKDDTAVFDPDSATRVMAQCRSVMASGRAATTEEVLTAAGVTRTYQTTQAPNRNAAGTVIGIIGIARDITDQKLAAKARFDSEERYRRLFEAARDGILIVDVTTRRILDANPFLADLLGSFRENLVGKELWEIGIFRDIAANKAAFESLRVSGYTRYDDLTIRNGRGETIDVEFVSNVYDVGDARVIQCNVRDITARKRAEQAVRASEERYRTLVAATAAIVWDSPPSGAFDTAQQQWTAFTGQTVEQHRGWGWLDAVHPDDRERSGAAWAEAVRDHTPYQLEHRLRRADGEYRQMSARAVPILDSHRVIREWVGVHTDVTMRARAEAALQLRDRAIGAATQGLLITDPWQQDNPLVYVSPGFERLTGYPAAEALGRNCRFLQGKDTDPFAVTRLREAVRAGEASTVELLNYRKDGSTFWNELSVSPVRDAAGRLTHFVGVQVDVTARRSLEEQFRQAQKMEAFGQLAGGVAHDFNNLLTVINGYSDLLLQCLSAADPSRELVAEIYKAGERSAGLTRQLLAFSRQQILAPRVLDLNAVVSDAEKLLRRLIGEDVRLTAILAPGLGAVRADPGQVEQVVMNLVVNARDAMPTGGRLTIETRNVELDEGYARTHRDARPGRHVLLSVSDTGSGMPPAVMARVFEPFFTTKEKGKGTGLGLATVLGIVRQSEGHVTIYSEVGIGTTIKVYLPRVEGAGGVAEARSGVRVLPRGAETILLIEDDDGVRHLARHVLTVYGYTVFDAAGGADALRVAGGYAGPIHLLVTDVVMPGMSGRQVVEEVAALHPETRVLFVSGYTDDAVVRHGILEEAVHFLPKPYSPSALTAKVRDVLDAPAAERA